jgi:hypothetical protein
MMSKVLVLDPPIANLVSTSGSLIHHQSQPRAPRQAPPPEVAEWPQQGIAVNVERDLDLAS